MSTLYIVATPIGNLEDITLRAIRILREVEIILCEDTRVSIKLLNHLGIEGKKLISLNKDNEGARIAQILSLLNQSQDLALISDAGTPLISDPGFDLIKILATESEHQLVPLPGPSSLTAALSVCPIDTSRFVYEGFLPHGPKQRRRVLKRLAEEFSEKDYPIVFFESPHRILKSLEDMKNIFGADKQIFIARELTKKFEQLYFGSLDEITAALETQFPKDVQGEFVVVLAKLC